MTEPFTQPGPLQFCRRDQHWWHGPALFTVVGAVVLAIRFGGAVVSVGLVVAGPVLQIAVVRTVAADD